MFSIAGAGGFLGRHLMAALSARGEPVQALERNPVLTGRPLGTLLFAAGVTSDFRSRPEDTFEAHVSALLPYLKRGEFDRFVYFSSTRVYRNADSTSEDAVLRIEPLDDDQSYDASKIAGESLCMSSSRSGISVVRLSNIYDRRFSGDQFLDRVVRSARMGSIRFETAPESERDFIEIDDAVDGILAVAQRGNARIYNVATGTNTSNAGIADALADRFQARIEFAANAPVTRFRPIDVSGLRKIHDRPARLVTDALRTLV